ncbi:Uncharacterised protein [Legionella beliardensis]|uniref:Uncharacterized protein n=1 Tax=Legionella beliardensis TaxID=91822 RepID=A0A378HZW2_9GAMM|nr:hypothetical protein [Legionella beliardensis]STX28000.1 Uncharacterised protein [Legionella beliardensis]
MILDGKRNTILAEINQLTRDLNQADFSSYRYYLEARYTLFHLKRILTNSHNTAMHNTLLKVLERRWQRIQDTDCQYLTDFTSPANQACINIAKTLGPIIEKSYLTLLMPSLERIPVSAYISSSYRDDDILKLQELTLDDTNERLIIIPDVLNSAQKDGVLKHSSLFNGRAKKLSVSEQERLLSRHPFIEGFYNAQQAVVDFKINGPTVGAAVNRLIKGLHEGGVWELGNEENAASNANEAILEFSFYLKTLDSAACRKLFKATRTEFDLDLEEDIIVPFKDYWENLADPIEMSEELSDEIKSQYCVQSIAVFLEEILEQNPDLYNLAPSPEDILKSLDELEEELEVAQDEMTHCFDSVEKQSCYSQGQDDLVLLTSLLSQLRHDKSFPLSANDVRFLIETYQTACQEDDTTIKRLCSGTIKNHTYAKNFMKEAAEQFNSEEKAIFSNITKKQWFTFEQPSPSSIGFFPSNNKKRRFAEQSQFNNSLEINLS